MIHPAHLRRLIQETLGRMGSPYDSPAAVELLMLTAAHESRLGTYLWQVGRDGEPRGPALGIYQMEPATHDDLFDSWLCFRPYPGEALARWRNAQALTWDLGYATACARLQYYRAPEPLPPADDVDALAAYWHRHWCRGCAGTPDQAAADYRELVGGGAKSSVSRGKPRAPDNLRVRSGRVPPKPGGTER